MATLKFDGWHGLENAIRLAASLHKTVIHWRCYEAQRRINARFDAWEAERAQPQVLQGADWPSVRAKATAFAAEESAFGKRLRERRELLDSFRL